MTAKRYLVTGGDSKLRFNHHTSHDTTEQAIAVAKEEAQHYRDDQGGDPYSWSVGITDTDERPNWTEFWHDGHTVEGEEW